MSDNTFLEKLMRGTPRKEIETGSVVMYRQAQSLYVIIVKGKCPPGDQERAVEMMGQKRPLFIRSGYWTGDETSTRVVTIACS